LRIGERCKGQPLFRVALESDTITAVRMGMLAGNDNARACRKQDFEPCEKPWKEADLHLWQDPAGDQPI
jgi:hypothetical protein